MTRSALASRSLGIAALAALTVAPCLTLPLQAQTPAATPPAAAPAAAPAATPAKPAMPEKKPDDLKTFEEVVKDAEAVPGMFNLYRTKKNEVWLEVTPEMLDRTYMLQVTSATGLGGNDGAITTGDPAYDVLFSLKRVRGQVFFSVRQTRFRAKEGEPIEKSLRRSFSEAVLQAFKVESQPHPERKSVLVNATNLFFGDLPAYAAQLTSALQTPFGLDRDKSYVDEVKSFPENVEVEVSYNFASGKGAATDTLPDGRSAQFRVRYSFLALKDTGYRPRRADSRVGYFVSAFRDLTDDDPKDEFTRNILRWDLRKKDPAAALSEPVKPIVFWLDNATPVRYRKPVADGLLLWNKAFEKIGFKNAVVVKQMPDGEPFDPFDVRYNMVRWATSPGDGYAVALFRENPLTGEIVNASIRVDASIVGFTRRSFRLEDELKAQPAVAPIPDARSAMHCEYGRTAMKEAAFALTAMDLRALQPGGLNVAERDRFVDEFIIEVIAHEMGHILGLRHNFKASTLHSLKELQDKAMTDQDGVTASVMDYTPANIAPAGVKQGAYFSTTVGPYDMWAIEYGYRQSADMETLAGEEIMLSRIAARSTERGHAFATDEEVSDFGFAQYATDPSASRFDLGADPVAYAKQRAQLVRGLYNRLEASSPRYGESYQDLRIKFGMLLGQYLNSFTPAAKHIGALYFNRAHRGDPQAPATPFTPVPVAKQREALAFITEGLFSADAFNFQPSLLNKLAMDRNWHWGIKPFEGQMAYSVPERVKTTQRSVMGWLFTPGLLSRLRDNEMRVARPADTLTIADLYEGVTGAIFSEVRQAGKPVQISAIRRDLQQDYLSTLLRLYKGQNGAPADAQSLARLQLRRLSNDMAGALTVTRTPDVTVRAHLEQCRERIQRALQAQSVSPD